MSIDWKDSNVVITEPDEEDFIGQDLEIVEKHAKYFKKTLKSMGIRDSDDQDKIIEKIKVLINKEKEEPTDVWEKNPSNDVNDKNKSKSSNWE